MTNRFVANIHKQLFIYHSTGQCMSCRAANVALVIRTRTANTLIKTRREKNKKKKRIKLYRTRGAYVPIKVSVFRFTHSSKSAF